MNIPIELRNLIDSEQTNFIVKSKRNYPKKKGMSLLLSSLLWNGLMSIFIISFILPILKGEEVRVVVNNVPTFASLDNLGPILIPGLIIM